MDTFARDRLPPNDQWPRLHFDLPELHYPARLNCATVLLDDAVAEGHGERPAILMDAGTVTYRELLARANRIANVLAGAGIVPGNRVLLRGYNGPEIGERLGITAKTVDTYKQRIEDKLGLSHRTEYVRFAVDAGLLGG